MGGIMKRIVITLIVATILSATTSATAFADGGRGYYHGRGGVVVDPFWPITWPIAAALSIPAAVIGTVANVAVPPPLYAPPPAPVYSGPAYYGPGPYYAPRVYYAPRGHYYAPRGYYHDRHYRGYRGGW
jgi:hypothetical protein